MVELKLRIVFKLLVAIKIALQMITRGALKVVWASLSKGDIGLKITVTVAATLLNFVREACMGSKLLHHTIIINYNDSKMIQ